MNELDAMWIIGVLTGMILTPILKDLIKSTKEERKSKRELIEIERNKNE